MHQDFQYHFDISQEIGLFGDFAAEYQALMMLIFIDNPHQKTCKKMLYFHISSIFSPHSRVILYDIRSLNCRLIIE